jgi:hypothetical protein
MKPPRRDPLADPRQGDRFRLRSSVEVTLVAAGLGATVTYVVDADGFRHPVKNAAHLVELLKGATALPPIDGLTALREGR